MFLLYTFQVYLYKKKKKKYMILNFQDFSSL